MLIITGFKTVKQKKLLSHGALMHLLKKSFTSSKRLDTPMSIMTWLQRAKLR